MTDLAIEQLDDGTFDVAIFDGDFVRDDSLRSAVLVSLFSDVEDPEAAGGDRRGWWGDALSPVVGDLTGSQLWKLDRAKILQDTVNQAQSYIQQALAWMVTDGLASAVTVTAQRVGLDGIGATIEIDRPTGTESYRLASIWEANLTSPFDPPASIADRYADTAASLSHILSGYPHV